MANVSSYIFDNMSRIGNDNCSMDQRSIQNVNTCNYTLQNYFATDCAMKNSISLATTQPGINYKGGFQNGAGQLPAIDWVYPDPSKVPHWLIPAPLCHRPLFRTRFGWRHHWVGDSARRNDHQQAQRHQAWWEELSWIHKHSSHEQPPREIHQRFVQRGRRSVSWLGARRGSFTRTHARHVRFQVSK